jgi:hypothetical protein
MRKLDAVLGRASYVGKDAFGGGGIPDPGAMVRRSLSVFLGALKNGCRQ